MTQSGAAADAEVVLGAGHGGGGEDILRARPGDGPGAVMYHLSAGTVLGLPGGGGGGIAGVLRDGAAVREPGGGIVGVLRAIGGTSGAVYQYNCNTSALTRLPGVGGDDILGVLRLAAAVNEPGVDILGALRANESGAVLYYNSGTIAHELGLGAGQEFRAVLVDEHGMDAERAEGIVGVLPANGAAEAYPYTTGTIPDLLGSGRGDGRVEGIHRVLPTNDPAAVYYYKRPSSPQNPRMGGGGRGEGLARVPIPKEVSGVGYYYSGSGMPENKTAMVTDVVITFDDEGFADKATGGRMHVTGHVRRALGVVGIAAASLVVTGLAGGAATTACPARGNRIKDARGAPD